MLSGKPTELDDVKVFVNFLFYTDPPHVVDFSRVHREGNMFSVNVIFMCPEGTSLFCRLPITKATLTLLEGLKPANMFLGFMSGRFMNRPRLRRCQAAAACWPC
jgi:hypothetical protein